MFVYMGRFVPLRSCQVLIQSISYVEIDPVPTQGLVTFLNFCFVVYRAM